MPTLAGIKVVVFGASGATGRLVVSQALARGCQVTAFVRRRERLTGTAPNLSLTEGDAADAAAVAQAVAHQDAVICTLGVGKPLRSDPAVIDGVRHMVDAATTAGARRLIYMSSFGIGESHAQTNIFFRLVPARILRHELADHALKESIVRASALDWTIVRPAKLTNGYYTGHYHHGEDLAPKSFLPTIPRADVAEFLVRQLCDARYSRRPVTLMP